MKALKTASPFLVCMWKDQKQDFPVERKMKDVADLL